MNEGEFKGHSQQKAGVLRRPIWPSIGFASVGESETCI